MSESTALKSKVFKEDVNLASGGSGADETATRLTSTGGTVTLTKLDASHIKFQSVAGSPDDLVDGGNDIDVGVNDLTIDGDLTVSGFTTAGIVTNDASGVISGGGSITENDLPTGINAVRIADGSVSNSEFQFLNGVTSAIQTQFSSLQTAINNRRPDVAIIWCQKNQNDDGDAITQTTWTDLTLTNESDPNSIVTLASNQFTLAAGTYMVQVTVPFYYSGGSTKIIRFRLVNVTDTSYTYGPTSGLNAYAMHSRSFVLTLADTKVFGLQAYTDSAGVKAGGASNLAAEVYQEVRIMQLA